MSGLLKLLGKGAKLGGKIDYELGSKTKGLESDAMDMGLLGRMPEADQVPMERAESARGMPKSIEQMLNAEAAERVAGMARKGAEMGGMEWYNLEPLRAQYIAKLGPEEGTARFNRFVEYVAATSPRARVAENIRRASYFDSLERQGIDATGMTNDDMPAGYGHLAHKNHMGLIGDIINEGGFSGVNRPKTSSFAENLKGNWAPLTADTHNMAALTGKKKSPTNVQYQYIEGFQSDIADKLGISPAQFQANVWMGGDTGVADSRPFIQVFDKVLERTAKKNKTTKSQALHDFIVNAKPLFGMGALTTAVAQLKEKLNGEDNGPSDI